MSNAKYADILEQSSVPKKVWKTALYLRLSRDDGTETESNSIASQREILKEYLKRCPDMELIEIYSDDGYSGTNFDRPDFIRMMEDVYSGKINCIVVKDLSRFGRNYIEIGNYLDNVFVRQRVRFVAINNNYDNLTRYEDVSIAGAVTIRIEHSLVAPKGATLESIKHVYSHPQGLAQCSNFMKAHGYTGVDTISTATGAELVSQKKDITCGAICNIRNAKIYGLEVLQQGIENNSNNYTRFVIIAANHTAKASVINEKKPNMASVLFTTKNEAGALYDALGIFKKENLSMNRLESRPIAGKPWKYWFYSDVVIPQKVENPHKYMEDFKNKLKAVAEDIRILGVYAE